ncbi:MAG: hypothetical protein HY913_05380 [Desulfomonile tiedjei]|nr:hypothetical protein [Desulfomonile tiedjei]
MKNALIIFGVLSLALAGVYGVYTSYEQTAATPAATFLLAADEEEEELAVDIKEEEIVGPDRTWNVQLG